METTSMYFTARRVRTDMLSTARIACISAILVLLLFATSFYGALSNAQSAISGQALSNAQRHVPIALRPVTIPISSTTKVNPNSPVLAFYYAWYTPSSWSRFTMWYVPTMRYNSNDDSTIHHQVTL